MKIPDKFCPECGKKSLAGAKFCTDCGTNLNSLAAKPPIQEEPEEKPVIKPKKQKAIATFVPTMGDDDEEGTIRADRVESISDLNISLSSLDVEIPQRQMPKETVGGLVSQGLQMGKEQAGQFERRPQMPKMDKNDFLNMFKKEGGGIKTERTVIE